MGDFNLPAAQQVEIKPSKDIRHNVVAFGSLALAFVSWQPEATWATFYSAVERFIG